jgi:hypothetical protein
MSHSGEGAWVRSRIGDFAVAADRISHEIEFSYLNESLMVPALQPPISESSGASS